MAVIGALVIALPLHDWLRKRSTSTAPTPPTLPDPDLETPPPLPGTEPATVLPPHGINLMDLLAALSLSVVFLALLAAQIKGASAGKTKVLATDEGPVIQFTEIFGHFVLTGLIVGIVCAFIKIAQGRSLRWWFSVAGIDNGPIHTPQLGHALSRGMFFGLVSIVLLTPLNIWINNAILEPLGFGATPQDVVEAIGSSSSVIYRLGLALAAVIAAPVMEEIVFRGFLYPVLRHFTSRPFAILFTGLFFGCIHANLGALLPLSLLGMGLCWLRDSSRSIILPIMAHASFNALSVTMIFLGSKAE
jgi:membrane protease YdiL (CAAX protease family)